VPLPAAWAAPFFAAVQRPACGKDKEDAAIQELSTCVTRDPELQPPTLTQSREPRAPLVLWFFVLWFFVNVDVAIVVRKVKALRKKASCRWSPYPAWFQTERDEFHLGTCTAYDKELPLEFPKCRSLRITASCDHDEGTAMDPSE
jgi:hypothetical protein